MAPRQEKTAGWILTCFSAMTAPIPTSDPPPFFGEPQSVEEAEAPVQTEPAVAAETVPAAEDSATGLPAETVLNDTTAPAAEHAPEAASL